MAEYLWRVFFVFVANCLLGKDEENVRLAERFADKGWISNFAACSVSSADEFAQHHRSRAMFVYEHGDSAMELLGPQSLSEQGDGMVNEAITEHEPKESDLACRDPLEPSQLFLLISLLRASPAQAVPNRQFLGRQVAHEPQTTDPATRIAAQVDNQPVTVSK